MPSWNDEHNMAAKYSDLATSTLRWAGISSLSTMKVTSESTACASILCKSSASEDGWTVKLRNPGLRWASTLWRQLLPESAIMRLPSLSMATPREHTAPAQLLRLKRVDTLPWASTLQMQLLEKSDTTAPPSPSNATFARDLEEDDAQRPSGRARERLLASVLTEPSGPSRRMQSLPRSTTMTMPVVSTATSMGSLNMATCAGPSWNPGREPAIVVTLPSGVTLRMQWFFVSATRTLPSLSTARPRGFRKQALSAGPSAKSA
mmetsp:Transcript_90460/g.292802  ORF Transcript_90460/g.292802 Transcript_90460/m.292802 type:complete len:262 (+) Transcript_90460:381-1166(+)